MQDRPWFEPLVWTDYRLALFFLVLLPFILLVWAFVQKNETIQRLITIYWRVASLLAITVYLLIAALPLGFVSSVMARVLIPISLWFWVDLNDELDDQVPSALKLTFTSWRWAVTVYNAIGAIAMLPFLQCAISKEAMNGGFCQVWRQPPLLFKEYFHANSSIRFLGFLGIVGLVFYVGYLSYFVLVKLNKQGRSASQY